MAIIERKRTMVPNVAGYWDMITVLDKIIEKIKGGEK